MELENNRKCKYILLLTILCNTHYNKIYNIVKEEANWKKIY